PHSAHGLRDQSLVFPVPILEVDSMAVEKVAIVIAGGSGMGAAAVKRLAADGFMVGVLSSSGKGEALADQFGGVGVTGSNKSKEDVGRLVDLALSRWGRID